VSDVFDFHEGDSPLLISIPHDGRELPPDVATIMTAAGRQIPDTDWHVARLYAFARELGASILSARYSRYVVDLNRPPDDSSLYQGKEGTGLCPHHTFSGEPIYEDTPEIDAGERLDRYWRPYHDQLAGALATLRARHGVALLWDAHSIASQVPMLFDGNLPALNIGTFGGQSCGVNRAQAVVDVATASAYDSVLNARFKGGYITRHYGDPTNGVHALQLELAQRCYMDEETKLYDESRASRLQDTLRPMLAAFTMQR
jgi:N-formylglutamate amidohydrolase